MKHFLFAFFLIIFGFSVFAADCIAPVPSCVDQPQCACLTLFETYDSEGTPTTNFGAGDTIYMDLIVKNAGTAKLENMKLFYLIYGGGTFPTGTYTTMVVDNQDIDAGKELPKYTNVQIPLLSNIPKEDPGQDYRLNLYVSSESYYYYQVPIKIINVINPNSDWVGVTISGSTRKAGTSWASSTYILPDGKFDMRSYLTNTNPSAPVLADIMILTGGIEACEIVPPDFSPLSGTAYTTRNISIPAGASKKYIFENCTLKESYKDDGSVYLTQRAYYNGNLLQNTYPRVVVEVPNIAYFNIWDTDPSGETALMPGEDKTIGVNLTVSFANLPPGSKAVFKFTDYINGESIPDVEVDISGLAIGNHDIFATITYPVSAPGPSNLYNVHVSLEDASGTPFIIIWGTTSKTFSPPSPNVVVDLAAGTVTPSAICTLTDITSLRKSLECTLPTGQQVVLIGGEGYDISDITVTGASQYIFQSVGDNQYLYVWRQSNPVVIEFSVHSEFSSIPAPDFIETLGIIGVASLFLFFFVRKIQ
ncbi:MAG: hypothetical protein ABIH20_03665 [Candidatus Diapherotrites archaeon]